MPPFVNTNCTKCKHPNRYDLAELRKKGDSFDKIVVYREEQSAKAKEEKFEVTCEHCGQKFKFKVAGGSDG